MALKEIENLFDEGLNALSAGRTEQALSCFEKAVEQNNTPLACSYLAYCQARISGTYKEAIAICMDARKEDPKNSDIYLNLGRVYLLTGNRRQAIQVFRLGLRQERNSRITNELNALGQRKSPPIPFLDRGNPINKYLGKLLTKLWLR
ncbi:MAG TPA: tetratricopeptide repeat protein [Geobacteraceae bacterium]|nr:tetratricopeptide repeat protein [Geobacteraceae bacterium]